MPSYLSQAPHSGMTEEGTYSCLCHHSFRSSHSPHSAPRWPQDCSYHWVPFCFQSPSFPHLLPLSHLGMVTCNCSFPEWLSVKLSRLPRLARCSKVTHSAAWKPLLHSVTAGLLWKTTKGWLILSIKFLLGKSLSRDAVTNQEVSPSDCQGPMFNWLLVNCHLMWLWPRYSSYGVAGGWLTFSVCWSRVQPPCLEWGTWLKESVQSTLWSSLMLAYVPVVVWIKMAPTGP